MFEAFRSDTCIPMGATIFFLCKYIKGMFPGSETMKIQMFNNRGLKLLCLNINDLGS